jgi:hypothetical protein
MSGQLHAPSALPITREAGRRGEEKKRDPTMSPTVTPPKMITGRSFYRGEAAKA